ncbi:hypothetical protein GE061_009793 [Apolygus lucorum]|uniref:C2H2-type domain-containing protein n=1 Tax=Apolygus lucorum TaxID=248454 RepID=A0A8S9Y2K9_APOLU|nr:hypothetical protein GE061_009793 [Apolygus lucorum]
MLLACLFHLLLLVPFLTVDCGVHSPNYRTFESSEDEVTQATMAEPGRISGDSHGDDGVPSSSHTHQSGVLEESKVVHAELMPNCNTDDSSSVVHQSAIKDEPVNEDGEMVADSLDDPGYLEPEIIFHPSKDEFDIPQIEKPFTCDSCDYRAGHLSTLKAHMKIHTGSFAILS